MAKLARHASASASPATPCEFRASFSSMFKRARSANLLIATFSPACSFALQLAVVLVIDSTESGFVFDHMKIRDE